MGNCADCGQNGVRGCKANCPADKSVSRWARYRARQKAKLEAAQKAKGGDARA